MLNLISIIALALLVVFFAIQTNARLDNLEKVIEPSEDKICYTL